MVHRVLFAGLLICGLTVCGPIRGFADDKEDIETRYFDDEILDKLSDLAIGAEFVPLAQVRQEFQKLVPDGNLGLMDEPDATNVGKLTLEALQDQAARMETVKRLHPLVPAQGKPCTGDGLVVTSIVSHGPAAEAGIRRGDVIYSVNGKKTTTLDDLKATLIKFDTFGAKFKVGVASYDPGRLNGISETSARAWKRGVISVSPALERFVLLAPLDRTPDAINGFDIYSHTDFVTLAHPMVMSLSFVRRLNSKPTDLFFRVRYSGKSWIFVDRMTVRADGQVFAMEVDRDDVTRDVAEDAEVTESVRLTIDTEANKKLLAAVLSSKKVLVRFSGAEGVKDIEVELAERANMAEVFKIYERLGTLDGETK